MTVADIIALAYLARVDLPDEGSLLVPLVAGINQAVRELRALRQDWALKCDLELSLIHI